MLCCSGLGVELTSRKLALVGGVFCFQMKQQNTQPVGVTQQITQQNTKLVNVFAILLHHLDPVDSTTSTQQCVSQCYSRSTGAFVLPEDIDHVVALAPCFSPQHADCVCVNPYARWSLSI